MSARRALTALDVQLASDDPVEDRGRDQRLKPRLHLRVEPDEVTALWPRRLESMGDRLRHLLRRDPALSGVFDHLAELLDRGSVEKVRPRRLRLDLRPLP